MTIVFLPVMEVEKHYPVGSDSLHDGVEDVLGAKCCPREDAERTKRLVSLGKVET
ncbi:MULTISPECIES: hypothetical protein [Photorhabdus]|uniref:Uncharacterized protein n=1 Tax=Photorhabdus luminescens TaxID=29488 RepID=A0A1G5QS06_PHOLU|nr:hypothetical protein [Photorhabdus luminescens]SCZ64368.1 hypothetical protein SAMN02982990_02206 [Photorhabdus luminescens]